MGQKKVCQKKFYIFLILIAVVIIFACEGPEGPAGPVGPSGEGGAWVNAVSHYEDCVYIIGIIASGDDYVTQIGTGWAISATQIMTNAHVAYGIYDMCRSYGYNSPSDKIVAVKNGGFSGQSGTYELVDCSVHTGYNNLNPFSADFAIFTVDTSAMTGYVAVQTSSSLYSSLSVGQGVGTLGFPGELSTSYMDGYQPIATFKSGTISALRPYDQRTIHQSPENNAVVQYNFATTGGTSGSPVFIEDGQTVAIHNSGIAIIVQDAYGDYVRIGLGDLNFGIRLDKSTDVLAMPFSAPVVNFRDSNPSSYSTLTGDQLRVELDWDTSYDFDLWLCFNGKQFFCGWLDYNDPVQYAYIYPFCVHHGDDWSYGPELATILQPSSEIKIYSQNWDSYYTSFSSSGVSCEVTNSAGTLTSVTNPPSGYEQFWIIGTISASGDFTLVNELTDENPIDNAAAGDPLTVLKEMGAQEKDRKILKKAVR